MRRQGMMTSHCGTGAPRHAASVDDDVITRQHLALPLYVVSDMMTSLFERSEVVDSCYVTKLYCALSGCIDWSTRYCTESKSEITYVEANLMYTAKKKQVIAANVSSWLACKSENELVRGVKTFGRLRKSFQYAWEFCNRSTQRTRLNCCSRAF